MKVIKQNMDVTRLDDEVVLKKNADAAYFREIQEKAKARGYFKRNGVDKQGRCFFVCCIGMYHYRYTLCD